MGFTLFPNYHFQMGVTVMGFAEDFGHGLISILGQKFGILKSPVSKCTN